MAGEYIEFHNNAQPALNETNVNRMQRLIKQDIVGTIGGDTLPVGTIVQFGGSIIPTNWLLCDGSEISRTDYAQLFDIIGTTYGSGDGFTTFNLPDYSQSNEKYIIKATQSAGVVATVVDNLNSTSSTNALSANQGRILNEKGKWIELASTTATSETTKTVQDLTNFSKIALICKGAETGQILASTIAPVEQFVASESAWSAVYAGEANNYSVRAWRLTDTSIKIKSASSYDTAILYGII